MYPFMTLPVHFHTVFLITVKIYPSTFLLFCMSTDVPLHHYNCAVYFFFFGITCTMTLQLVYWGTYTQIHPNYIMFTFMLLFRLTTTTYLSPQLLLYLPIAVPVHDLTCSFCRLSFQLTVKIYPSTFILFYMYTDVPVHHYTCSVYFFFFGITCTITFQLIYPKITRTMTFQLVYWSTYKQIHRKINLPV